MEDRRAERQAGGQRLECEVSEKSEDSSGLSVCCVWIKNQWFLISWGRESAQIA